MDNRTLNYLALARKAGLAELGEEPVGAAARAGKAHLILVAGDASEHTWRRAKSFAAGTDQQVLRLAVTKEEMGFVIGRTSLAIAAITDASLALALVVGGHPIGFEIFALLSLPLIFLRTHTGVKINKWFFYWFYPAHLLVLFLLQLVVPAVG